MKIEVAWQMSLFLLISLNLVFDIVFYQIRLWKIIDFCFFCLTVC